MRKGERNYADYRCTCAESSKRGETESCSFYYDRWWFVVHDIKVIEGEKGLFIAMPSKKAMDGEYRDIAHPINSGTREKIQSTILGKYEEALEKEPEEEVQEA